MASATLVEFDLQAGARLLQALDQRDLNVEIAFWALLEEYSDWRFFLASPRLDGEGIFDSYHRVITIARDLRPPLPNFHFDIRRMDEPFIDDIRQRVGLADYGARFGGQTFGRSYVEDAFVYRIR